MQDPIYALDTETPFEFQCDPQRHCFNECCRDLSQAITPYDALCLKNGLKLASAEFLARFTSRQTGPESGLPVVVLDPAPGPEKRCPFVTPEGCGVYDCRPASCRIYPLMRAVSRNRQTGQLTEHFALLREPHCLGFTSGKIWTAHDWMTSQGLDEYNRMNDGLMTLIALKNQKYPGPLSMPDGLLFYRTLYDLDDFRRTLFADNCPHKIDAPEKLLENARANDTALLQIAYTWIAQTLFA